MALRPIRPSANDKADLIPVRLVDIGYPGKQLILGILSSLALFTGSTKDDILRDIPAIDPEELMHQAST